MSIVEKLKGLVKKQEVLSAVDIGSSGIKLIEFDDREGGVISRVGFAPLGGEVFTNYMLSQSERISEQLAELLQTHGVVDNRIATSVPGPSAFTKRVKTAQASLAELSTNIRFEAGNFIPHNIDNVRLDFHILGPTGKNQLDVLVVAVKNEVVDSILGCFGTIGLDVAVIDIDYYALQNCFERVYPEELSKCVALVNVGTKYSIVNICAEGQSLFAGDIQVGGRQFSEALSEILAVPLEQAELIKRGEDKKHSLESVMEALQPSVTEAAIELNRQLTFFWNASGAEAAIEKIYLSGGGALTPGLREVLAEKTGMPCEVLNPFRGMSLPTDADTAMLEAQAPVFAIALGVAMREAGDRDLAEVA